MSRRRPRTAPAERCNPARTLNERERKFVEHFMASGNATRAAAEAGYSRKTASQLGYRLLRNVQIQQAIAARVEHDPAVWSREQRQRFWTAVASAAPGYAKASLKDRLRASELLGKSQADFIERHELNAGASLVELLAEVVTRGRAEGDR